MTDDTAYAEAAWFEAAISAIAARNAALVDDFDRHRSDRPRTVALLDRLAAQRRALQADFSIARAQQLLAAIAAGDL